jgi:hypothetical protein
MSAVELTKKRVGDTRKNKELEEKRAKTCIRIDPVCCALSAVTNIDFHLKRLFQTLSLGAGWPTTRR